MTESVIASAANALQQQQQAKAVQHESEAAAIEAASVVKSPDRTFEGSERASLEGAGNDTDDASSYKTCNSGSASLSSTQMLLTANSTLQSANVTKTTDEGSSVLSDASTPREEFLCFFNAVAIVDSSDGFVRAQILLL